MSDLVSSDICIPNIGPKERRIRLVGGLVSLAIAAIIGVALFALGAGRWWRLILFLFFYSGAAGIFQWREKT